MAKYGIGELVRFKASKLLASTCSYFIKISTDRLVGRVIGRVETAGEETRYYVEVKLSRGFSTSASGILGILGSSDITLRLSVLESQLQSKMEFARTGNMHHADGLVSADGGDKKMSKSRCVKNELKSGLENERNLHVHFAKECDKLRVDAKLLKEKVKLLDEIINTHCKEKAELKDHLDEVKGCNEKMAKDLAILREDNEKLKAKNTTLEQSNKLMEAKLTLLKGRVSELAQSDKEGKEYIDYLLSRGMYARILNKK